jgi:hypothetical protein
MRSNRISIPQNSKVHVCLSRSPNSRDESLSKQKLDKWYPQSATANNSDITRSRHPFHFHSTPHTKQSRKVAEGWKSINLVDWSAPRLVMCIYLNYRDWFTYYPCFFVSRMQHWEWYGLRLLYGMMARSNGMYPGRQGNTHETIRTILALLITIMFVILQPKTSSHLHRPKIILLTMFRFLIKNSSISASLVIMPNSSRTKRSIKCTKRSQRAEFSGNGDVSQATFATKLPEKVLPLLQTTSPQVCIIYYWMITASTDRIVPQEILRLILDGLLPEVLASQEASNMGR